MHVEVIRDVNTLRIRWSNEAGDRWTVTKRFNLGTRTMEEVQVDCSAEAWPIEEGRQAQALADQIDAVFLQPGDFDRIFIADDYTDDGSPARIWHYFGKIQIAIAPRGAQ